MTCPIPNTCGDFRSSKHACESKCYPTCESLQDVELSELVLRRGSLQVLPSGVGRSSYEALPNTRRIQQLDPFLYLGRGFEGICRVPSSALPSRTSAWKVFQHKRKASPASAESTAKKRPTEGILGPFEDAIRDLGRGNFDKGLKKFGIGVGSFVGAGLFLYGLLRGVRRLRAGRQERGDDFSRPPRAGGRAQRGRSQQREQEGIKLSPIYIGGEMIQIPEPKKKASGKEIVREAEGPNPETLLAIGSVFTSKANDLQDYRHDGIRIDVATIKRIGLMLQVYSNEKRDTRTKEIYQFIKQLQRSIQGKPRGLSAEYQVRMSEVIKLMSQYHDIDAAFLQDLFTHNYDWIYSSRLQPGPPPEPPAPKPAQSEQKPRVEIVPSPEPVAPPKPSPALQPGLRRNQPNEAANDGRTKLSAVWISDVEANLIPVIEADPEFRMWPVEKKQEVVKEFHRRVNHEEDFAGLYYRNGVPSPEGIQRVEISLEVMKNIEADPEFREWSAEKKQDVVQEFVRCMYELQGFAVVHYQEGRPSRDGINRAAVMSELANGHVADATVGVIVAVPQTNPPLSAAPREADPQSVTPPPSSAVGTGEMSIPEGADELLARGVQDTIPDQDVSSIREVPPEPISLEDFLKRHVVDFEEYGFMDQMEMLREFETALRFESAEIRKRPTEEKLRELLERRCEGAERESLFDLELRGREDAVRLRKVSSVRAVR